MSTDNMKIVKVPIQRLDVETFPRRGGTALGQFSYLDV